MVGKLSIKKRFFCKILEFWMKSLRISWKSPETQQGPGILALWHRDLFAATAAFRDRGISAFISPSGDGEFLAKIASDLGYRIVRGSSSEQAFRIREVLRTLRAGNLCAMALDGPKGPAGIAKPGTRWLSEQSGHPCFLVEIRYGRPITLKSWDKAKVPLPFSQVILQIRKMSSLTESLSYF